MLADLVGAEAADQREAPRLIGRVQLVGEAQETGSKYLEVWESTDLVNWSDQRHIKVSSDFAGNTWAPEAFYDAEAGEYVVYWASALYPTTDVAGFRNTVGVPASLGPPVIPAISLTWSA